MIESKSTRKFKKKFADCRLKTAYLPFLLMIPILILSITTELHPTIRYVSHTGSSTPPYTSWETAADSIQKAIDICEPGDTVLVANGVYYETLYIDKTIHLIGSSMDSTIIDGSQNDTIMIVDFFENNSSIQNFNIIGPGSQKNGINTWKSNILAQYCRISKVRNALAIGTSSVVMRKFYINDVVRGIFNLCAVDTCNSLFMDFVIFINSPIESALLFFTGGSPTLKNNIIIGANSWQGATFESQRRVVFKNNLISGFNHRNVSVASHSDTVFLINNNSMNVQQASGFYTSQGSKTVIRNNIIQNTIIGVSAANPVSSDYNLFNNVSIGVNGGAYLGEGNVFADPMFVNDTTPRPSGSYDLHLQKYSPAIDAGDPAILDVDGSRSDIGMYGGPLGESYKYRDLAPKPPRNLSAIVDSNYILVKWNRNTETDTSHYNVYRDTVANFTIDSTKLISSETDTFYIQYPPYQSSRYVYKITCVDNQGNESLPSEELVINITSLPMNDYPMTISDYILYQNYPNPFNPSTTIAYKLKERAYVKLMVYDIKGELISVLVNKEQDSGYYEVEFNVGNGLPSVPNNLASGIYLYRIEVIGEGRIPVYTEMKKMLLVK